MTPGDGQLTVTWPAVDPGTVTLDGYGVTATPGPVGCTPGTSTSCVITGLTNGTAYPVRVTATWVEGVTTSFVVTGTPTVNVAPPGLAITGDNVAWTVGTGTVILLAGVALVRYGRRRTKLCRVPR